MKNTMDIDDIKIVPMEQPELPPEYLTDDTSGGAVEYKNPEYETAIKFYEAGIQKGFAIGKFLQEIKADRKEEVSK